MNRSGLRARGVRPAVSGRFFPGYTRKCVCRVSESSSFIEQPFHQQSFSSDPKDAFTSAGGHRVCCRCRQNLCSTPANAYCKACRAAYQREWRARRKTEAPCMTETPRPKAMAIEMPRVRLRGTPTRADLLRYNLL